jgi:hypothetical protein
MIRALRQIVGGAIGVAAVALPAWAMFHLVRQGSCGNVGQATCPDEVGLWILGLVGAFVILCPVAIFLAGTDRATGQLLLLAPIVLLAPLAFVAGIVVSLVGESSDPGSHWIGVVLGGLIALIVIRVFIGFVRRLRRAPATMPKLTRHPVDAAEMQQLAVALQKAQIAKSAPAKPAKAAAKPDPALAARLQKLDELHDAGLIDDAEHRRRRDEILAEI